MEAKKEEATKKRPAELRTAGELSPKKSRTPEPLFSFSDEDESAEELTRLLEGPDVAPFKVRFVPYPYTWRSISPPPPSSYITINVGNEESCGSSFSDCEYSLMASIDLAGLNIVGFGVGEGPTEFPGGGACIGDSEENRGWKVKDCGGDSWDWDDLDEALATFLGNEGIFGD